MKLENAKALGWVQNDHFTGMKWRHDAAVRGDQAVYRAVCSQPLPCDAAAGSRVFQSNVHDVSGNWAADSRSQQTLEYFQQPGPALYLGCGGGILQARAPTEECIGQQAIVASAAVQTQPFVSSCVAVQIHMSCRSCWDTWFSMVAGTFSMAILHFSGIILHGRQLCQDGRCIMLNTMWENSSDILRIRAAV